MRSVVEDGADMSEFAPTGRPQIQSAVERAFDDLTAQLERAAFLYGVAATLDLERARQIRRAFDANVAKSESFLRRDDETSAAHAFAGIPNRAQRIEAEIVDFVLQMEKPVTIDEVLEHLNGCSLGEPRASLITRMSRMTAAGKIVRTGRGYYEPGADAGTDD